MPTLSKTLVNIYMSSPSTIVSGRETFQVCREGHILAITEEEDRKQVHQHDDRPLLQVDIDVTEE